MVDTNEKKTFQHRVEEKAKTTYNQLCNAMGMEQDKSCLPVQGWCEKNGVNENDCGKKIINICQNLGKNPRDCKPDIVGCINDNTPPNDCLASIQGFQKKVEQAKLQAHDLKNKRNLGIGILIIGILLITICSIIFGTVADISTIGKLALGFFIIVGIAWVIAGAGLLAIAYGVF